MEPGLWQEEVRMKFLEPGIWLKCRCLSHEVLNPINHNCGSEGKTLVFTDYTRLAKILLRI